MKGSVAKETYEARFWILVSASVDLFTPFALGLLDKESKCTFKKLPRSSLWHVKQSNSLQYPSDGYNRRLQQVLKITIENIYRIVPKSTEYVSEHRHYVKH